MGSNYVDFLREARRVLKPRALLKIAEVSSRFANLPAWLAMLDGLGFRILDRDGSNSHFLLFTFRKRAAAPPPAPSPRCRSSRASTSGDDRELFRQRKYAHTHDIRYPVARSSQARRQGKTEPASSCEAAAARRRRARRRRRRRPSSHVAARYDALAGGGGGLGAAPPAPEFAAARGHPRVAHDLGARGAAARVDGEHLVQQIGAVARERVRLLVPAEDAVVVQRLAGRARRRSGSRAARGARAGRPPARRGGARSDTRSRWTARPPWRSRRAAAPDPNQRTPAHDDRRERSPPPGRRAYPAVAQLRQDDVLARAAPPPSSRGARSRDVSRPSDPQNALGGPSSADTHAHLRPIDLEDDWDVDRWARSEAAPRISRPIGPPAARASSRAQSSAPLAPSDMGTPDSSRLVRCLDSGRGMRLDPHTAQTYVYPGQLVRREYQFDMTRAAVHELAGVHSPPREGKTLIRRW